MGRRGGRAGHDGPPRGRELEIADLLSFIKHAGVRNTVWLTADVHYTAAHYYDPNKAAFQDFEPFWEFVSGPIHAGCFAPNELDSTFGPQLMYVKAPSQGAGARTCRPRPDCSSSATWRSKARRRDDGDAQGHRRPRAVVDKLDRNAGRRKTAAHLLSQITTATRSALPTAFRRRRPRSVLPGAWSAASSMFEVALLSRFGADFLDCDEAFNSSGGLPLDARFALCSRLLALAVIADDEAGLAHDLDAGVALGAVAGLALQRADARRLGAQHTKRVETCRPWCRDSGRRAC